MIPLNLNSVLLFLHNSKLAYWREGAFIQRFKTSQASYSEMSQKHPFNITLEK